LRDQICNEQESYIREIDFLRNKFTHDSETVKLALDKLLSRAKDGNGLSSEIVNRLNRFMNNLENCEDDEDIDLKISEKFLSEVEKEVITILSGQFKK